MAFDLLFCSRDSENDISSFLQNEIKKLLVTQAYLQVLRYSVSVHIFLVL